MYRVARVAVENTAWDYDKLYSYLAPGELAGQILPGVRVTVPFGGGNRRRTGIVVETGETDSREGLKPIAAILDTEPLLNEEGLLLLRYVKESTFCTWFDALRLLIPAGIGILREIVYSPGELPPGFEPTPLQAEMLAYIKTKRTPVEQRRFCGFFGIGSEDAELAALLESGAIRAAEKSRRRINDCRERMVRRSGQSTPAPSAPKQKLALSFIEEAGTASLREVCYYTGVTRVVVDALERRGFVEYFDAERLRDPYSGRSPVLEQPPELSPAQQAAYEALAEFCGEEKPEPALLYGVTGSGKTQVFLKLVQKVVDQGKSVLVMAPEISLTSQMADGFRRRFGSGVAILHSALSLGERMDEWKRIRSGKARVVVGTRSAVFAPLSDIGLIVIDEEQEHTYRSDRTPRFHAREVALKRCHYHRAMLLLSSATPSIESFYLAKHGKYRLVSLEERYSGSQLPDVYVVDLRDGGNLSASPAFSQRLLDEIYYNLEHGEQSILLLNRRGYAPVVKCGKCGQPTECPHCSVSLTYHLANDSFICHYCGYMRDKASACGKCGSELIRYAGSGTQKLEQELSALFPEARVLRVDADSTLSKFSHERLFGAFAAHEYDIMIGTQMVAKGLNFPEVTLVGVLNADQSLYAGDFRGYERAFSLLTQVVGRSGRGQRRGRAVIQTFSPENPVIRLASEQDYTTFYSQEIESRRLHLYPPFCCMAAIGFVGGDPEQVRFWAGQYLDQFRNTAAAHYPGLPIRALGPSPSELFKAAGKYRYKIILKCKNSTDTRELLARMLDWFYAQCKTVSVFVDMNYDRI